HTEHKERAVKAGMDGHKAKPVELSQLRELIEHWVAKREQRQAQTQTGSFHPRANETDNPPQDGMRRLIDYFSTFTSRA
ncbi:hypothetical protein QN412_24885, partial [Pseudomonas sp. RTB3]|uniref:hypothetical protein n=1 Tax=Pseudomonas sp. RTB3 TaxID=3048633 RepID=UPI002B23E804